MKRAAIFDKYQAIFLFILFMGSFTLKVHFVYNEFDAYGTSKWSDAMVYLEQGKQIAQGNFLPRFNDKDIMISGPVVPIIVASAQLLTQDPIWPVLVINCLFSALMVYVLFSLGKRLISKLYGYLLAIWSIFNFSLIKFNYQILKEPLLFILLPLLILLMVKLYQDEKKLWTTIWLSASFSLLIHTDERFLIYGPLIVLFVFFVVKPDKRISLAALWIAVLVITMIPWTIRNYNQYHELVILTPRTTAFTSRLWGSDHSGVHFSSDDLKQAKLELSPAHKEVASKYGVQPRQYGRFEKYRMAFYHYWKPAYFKLSYIQYGFRPVKWSLAHNLNGILFYGIFLPFYVFGLVLAFIRKYYLIAFFAVFPILHSIMHAVMIWPLERYRLPMDFIVVLVGLWFIALLLKRYRPSKMPA